MASSSSTTSSQTRSAYAARRLQPCFGVLACFGGLGRGGSRYVEECWGFHDLKIQEFHLFYLFLFMFNVPCFAYLHSSVFVYIMLFVMFQFVIVPFRRMSVPEFPNNGELLDPNIYKTMFSKLVPYSSYMFWNISVLNKRPRGSELVTLLEVPKMSNKVLQNVWE